jgi:predicted Zn finger-like uncharacterized protein
MTIMPIRMTCPGCQAPFELPDEMAGQSVRCSECKHVFEVSAPPADQPVPPVEETAPAELVEEKPAQPQRRSAPPAERPASIAVAIILSAFFLMTLLGIAGLATLWIALHLGPPIPSATAPAKDFRLP